MASPLADFVVSLGTNGKIASQGSVTDALAKDSRLEEEFTHEKEAIELGVDVDEDEKDLEDGKERTDGKLTVAEEVRMGNVSKGACKSFDHIYRRFVQIRLQLRCFSVVWVVNGPSCSGSNLLVDLGYQQALMRCRCGG